MDFEVRTLFLNRILMLPLLCVFESSRAKAAARLGGDAPNRQDGSNSDLPYRLPACTLTVFIDSQVGVSA